MLNPAYRIVVESDKVIGTIGQIRGREDSGPRLSDTHAFSKGVGSVLNLMGRSHAGSAARQLAELQAMRRILEHSVSSGFHSDAQRIHGDFLKAMNGVFSECSLDEQERLQEFARKQCRSRQGGDAEQLTLFE